MPVIPTPQEAEIRRIIEAGTLPLEPLHQPLFEMGFFLRYYLPDYSLPNN
jgi:hypothetical protein